MSFLDIKPGKDTSFIMPDKRIVRANAKINLLLDILGVLDNGYHSLYMIMQSVDFCDTVTVSLDAAKGIHLYCDAPNIPCDERNTAYRAAAAFFEATGIEIGAKIRIEKRIPMAAGLAGGSADAAAVLFALNDLTGKPLTDDGLLAVGVTVGADIPFCLKGGTALAQDIGGVLSSLPLMRDCHIVLAKPAHGVSTKEAYKAYDTAWWIRHPKNPLMLSAAVRGDLYEMGRYCENVFEQVVDIPRRADIKYIMREAGAIAACMTGSGSTVYGIFEKKDGAKQCADALKSVVPEIFLTKPHKSGVYFE